MTQHADHHLEFTGVQTGFPMWDLHCMHGPESYYTDNEGVAHEDCIVQDWWDADGFDIIDSSTDFTWTKRLLLWTTWNYSSEPTLVGKAGYEYWKECQE